MGLLAPRNKSLLTPGVRNAYLQELLESAVPPHQVSGQRGDGRWDAQGSGQR